ncbi:hypothetical protein [Paraburkholderia bannensis]|uniref:hypothetical protein n=1 Tax=Paraburkholderia bannensis TaxID=765414 RepID=UPI002AB726A1|nr:hypothetical protein [Paraburkholderia bannensis]
MSESHMDGSHETSRVQSEMQIRIDIERYTEYRGTQSQLEAEGIVPANFEWPLGKKWVKWSANGLDFSLCRTKSEAMKGPAKLWLEVDYWLLRFSPADASWESEQIRLKARELRCAIHRQSNEWWQIFHATASAFRNSQNDEKFQAFKRLIPALEVDKRFRGGRRVSKSESRVTPPQE